MAQADGARNTRSDERLPERTVTKRRDPETRRPGRNLSPAGARCLPETGSPPLRWHRRRREPASPFRSPSSTSPGPGPATTTYGSPTEPFRRCVRGGATDPSAPTGGPLLTRRHGQLVATSAQPAMRTHAAPCACPEHEGMLQGNHDGHLAPSRATSPHPTRLLNRCMASSR